MRELDTELDLGDYLSLFGRRWRLVAVTALVIVGLVALFTVTRSEVYRSRAEVLILTDTSRGLFSMSDEVHERLKRNALAETDFLRSQDFRITARDTSGFDPDISYDLSRQDENREVADSSVIVFIVEAESATEAADSVNAYADVYIETRQARDLDNAILLRDDADLRRSELEQQRLEVEAELAQLRDDVAAETNPLNAAQLAAELNHLVDDTDAALEILSGQIAAARQESVLLDQVIAALDEPNATAVIQNSGFVPRAPISPNVPRNLIFGAIAGLVLGLAAAIARDLLDKRARDGAEIAQLVDVPVIAAIGQLPAQRSAPGRVRRFPDLTDADASGYRVLLNSLWLSTIDGPLQSIAFTSDRPGVGKTQTVVNLAQAEAARGTSVLIVDTDFVNPSIAERLDLDRPSVGLGDLLGGAASIDSAVVPTGISNLDLIDAFSVGEHAGDLLRSDKLRFLLTELYVRYDLIILDSPPTLSTADSRLVASQADAAVVVYDPSLSRVDELQRAIELLRSARVNLIGLVANRSQASHPVYVSARER